VQVQSSQAKALHHTSSDGRLLIHTLDAGENLFQPSLSIKPVDSLAIWKIGPLASIREVITAVLYILFSRKQLDLHGKDTRNRSNQIAELLRSASGVIGCRY
jgi:hypothetical protein